MILGGMDEAGRGPAIGPIVFGLVLITPKQEKKLKDAGVYDSKSLSAKKREELREIIISTVTEYATYYITAEQIDKKRLEMTMNEIEVEGFRHLIKPFSKKIDELQLDAADVNAERFGNQFKDLIEGKIDSRHKGDSIFTSVAAASILAKVKRDQIIEMHQKEMDIFDVNLPSFGSGYPAQAKPFLEAYIKKYKHLPKIARHSWKTCSSLKEIYLAKQSSLDNFF